jgi:hypothetical protein
LSNILPQDNMWPVSRYMHTISVMSSTDVDSSSTMVPTRKLRSKPAHLFSSSSFFFSLSNSFISFLHQSVAWFAHSLTLLFCFTLSFIISSYNLSPQTSMFTSLNEFIQNLSNEFLIPRQMMMMKEEDEKKEDTLMLVLFGGQLSRPWIAPKTAGMQSKSSLTRGNGYFNRPSHTVFDDDAQGYSGMHAQINDV